MARSPYPDLYHRLVANTAEPENAQACWCWTAKRDRWGYGRLNVYVPGLGGVATLMAHISLWVWMETSPVSVDEFYLYYQEFVASGLELDHLCVTPNCVYPGHHEAVTASVNCQRRNARRDADLGFSPTA